jgi:predicted RNA-binding Zn ribbon-like protein
MTHAPSAESRFLYIAGDPALDLVNTVDWTSRGPEQERLETFEQLTRWAEGAGVKDAASGRRLRRLGERHPRLAAEALAYGYRVRGTLRELFGAIARGESADPELARFNSLLRDALYGLEMGREGAGAGHARYRWRWEGEGSELRAPLWRVLWSAASLLSSEEVGDVRACDGDDCGWMYVDRSRNGLRRWCQMRTCGTREKTRRRRVTGDGTDGS